MDANGQLMRYDIPIDKAITKTIVKSVCKYSVTVRNIILSTSAELEVRLFGSADEFLDIVIISLTGEAYTIWGENDTYIKNFVEDWLVNNYGDASAPAP